MYQLIARSMGANNLSDCSSMWHESQGVALLPTIGVVKGTVSLKDIEQAELVFVVGQNLGTNHPRMLDSGDRVNDEFLQNKVGGDQALSQTLGHILLRKDAENPGTIVDREFIYSGAEGLGA